MIVVRDASVIKLNLPLTGDIISALILSQALELWNMDCLTTCQYLQVLTLVVTKTWSPIRFQSRSDKNFYPFKTIMIDSVWLCSLSQKMLTDVLKILIEELF